MIFIDHDFPMGALLGEDLFGVRRVTLKFLSRYCANVDCAISRLVNSALTNVSEPSQRQEEGIHTVTGLVQSVN